MNFTNKTILTTGGALGIGLEAARQFSDLGVKVISTGRNQDRLDTAKKYLPKKWQKALSKDYEKSSKPYAWATPNSLI